MIDEKIIIDKIEQIKQNSKDIMSDRLYIKQSQFEYFLNKLIDFINESTEKI